MYLLDVTVGKTLFVLFLIVLLIISLFCKVMHEMFEWFNRR